MIVSCFFKRFIFHGIILQPKYTIPLVIDLLYNKQNEVFQYYTCPMVKLSIENTFFGVIYWSRTKIHQWSSLQCDWFGRTTKNGYLECLEHMWKNQHDKLIYFSAKNRWSAAQTLFRSLWGGHKRINWVNLWS